MPNLFLILGDITTEQVDAIVNAANPSLAGGGGVDGAIHAAAGPELKEAAVKLAPCPTGEARITPGFHLPAKFVIHTVGPVYGEEQGREAALLASCYAQSLALAEEQGATSIAFPCISTGVYGYPKAEAAAIAVEAVKKYFVEHPTSSMRDVRFVVHREEEKIIYQDILQK
ncbi:MAG: O-acetyl-ADP-ribose deacetylase [Patescibacteria group bacterium]|jgi:O-acetyl-ADP-ribose deacetylase (regulator of RNase III)